VITNLVFASASDIAARVASGSVTAVEVAEACLARIAGHDRRLNSFIRVTPDLALDAARHVDDAVRAGRPPGPLAGVPVAVKDLIDITDIPTTAGAHRRFHVTPRTDATVVSRLRMAGAILVGKTGLHEFAYGVTNINPHTGPVRNPLDRSRIPGGSSGGSAVAVAAGFCAAALGSDTGGSIRIPASLCGVTGLKPTIGLVPVAGVVPLAWTLDHIGPLARTAADAGLLLSVLAQMPQLAHIDRGSAGLRVGLPRAFFWEGLDPEVGAACRDAIAALTTQGMAVSDVVIPRAAEAGAAASLILAAEAAAVHQLRLREHGEAYGEDVRVRLDRGLFLSAADYLLAQRARSFLTREYVQALAGVNVLVTPTTIAPAAPIAEDVSTAATSSLAMSLQFTRFTNPFNLTGLPALSVPCGFTKEGLPIGLQIVGRPFDEATVLRVGHAFQEATDWHERRPPL
jgi:aspartyl-tRNA(Asn)/glutamyl-tRNA(Gln) amidotransferase subunit A